jgi:hypothetical protein
MNLRRIRRARAKAGLHVVTFNVWQGQSVTSLKRNLLRMVKALGQPHIILLQEAHKWKSGSIKGYQAVRCWQNANDVDNANITLVRNDGKIVRRGSRRVKGGQWTWNGNDKPARVFLRVVVSFAELGDTVWDVINVHRIPKGPDQNIEKNREAWAQEHKLIRRWVRGINRRRPNRVIIVGGDMNSRLSTEPQHPYSLATLVDQFPNPSYFAMKGIDGFFTVNGTPGFVFELHDKFGSDAHQPVSAHVKAA